MQVFPSMQIRYRERAVLCNIYIYNTLYKNRTVICDGYIWLGCAALKAKLCLSSHSRWATILQDEGGGRSVGYIYTYIEERAAARVLPLPCV